VSHGFVRDSTGPFSTFDAPGAAVTQPFTINAAGGCHGVLLRRQLFSPRLCALGAGNHHLVRCAQQHRDGARQHRRLWRHRRNDEPHRVLWLPARALRAATDSGPLRSGRHANAVIPGSGAATRRHALRCCFAQNITVAVQLPSPAGVAGPSKELTCSIGL
jgi:hypothetical protein